MGAPGELGVVVILGGNSSDIERPDLAGGFID
jgi:hypothetical protein